MPKLILMSDTHLIGFPHSLEKYPGDVCLHLGDLMQAGDYDDWIVGKRQLKKLREAYSAVYFLPGNHDKWVEQNTSLCREELEELDINLVIDQQVKIAGLNIYFTPWMVRFFDWSFMRTEEQLELTYSVIPKGLDLLCTHGPPYMINDMNKRRDHCGSTSLAKAIREKKPTLFAAGHIHPQIQADRHYKDANTEYFNVSIMSDAYDPIWEPTVLEL